MGMLPESVRGVLTRLENAGFEAWCVGGCVRDLLLDRCPADWDVTTSALPEQTLALFGADARPTGLRHGTVTVGSGREAVEIIPLDRILLETDCPYLAPEPNRGKRNDSRNLAYVVSALAGLKGVSEEEAIEITQQNARRFFGL